jgi:polysaccharide deacetylase 2 family uncharacterized protein YibQ
MAKSVEGHKKNGRRSSGKTKKAWVVLAFIFLSFSNLLFLDTLLGIRLEWHFLPKPVYTPVFNLFAPPQLSKTIPQDIPRGKGIEKARPAKIPGARNNTLQKKTEFPPKRKETPLYAPRVALVIDDLGYNPDLAEKLLSIDCPFTVSVLPNLPYTNHIARRAIQKGKEVILHLPMEPYDYPNASVEKGTILTTMEDDEIRALIKKAIASLDGAVGANNHMGSRMIEDKEKMEVILTEMKGKGFFFLDSKTSPGSIVSDVAHSVGVKTAERDIFLDGKDDVEYIHTKLEEVAALAQKNGSVIAIGHLHLKTIKALESYLSELKKRGIQFVKLSEVVE